MKLVDLIVLILRAYAETLSALTDRIGPDMVAELLERMEDLDLPEGWLGLEASQVPVGTETFGEDASDALARLESSVETLMPISMRFYVWSFPLYRFFAEGPFDLSRTIPKGPESQQLVEAIYRASQNWSANFPVTDQARAVFTPVCKEIWLKMRAQAFQSLGISLLR